MVKTLVMFSAIMVALPVGTFFAFYDFLLSGERVVTRVVPLRVDEKVKVTSAVCRRAVEHGLGATAGIMVAFPVAVTTAVRYRVFCSRYMYRSCFWADIRRLVSG